MAGHTLKLTAEACARASSASVFLIAARCNSQQDYVDRDGHTCTVMPACATAHRRRASSCRIALRICRPVVADDHGRATSERAALHLRRSSPAQVPCEYIRSGHAERHSCHISSSWSTSVVHPCHPWEVLHGLRPRKPAGWESQPQIRHFFADRHAVVGIGMNCKRVGNIHIDAMGVDTFSFRRKVRCSRWSDLP